MPTRDWRIYPFSALILFQALAVYFVVTASTASARTFWLVMIVAAWFAIEAVFLVWRRMNSKGKEGRP